DHHFSFGTAATQHFAHLKWIGISIKFSHLCESKHQHKTRI
ncbi:MAG: hypothetical protein, partial [Olavius algarvensis Delta 4 endosymbiont]